MRCLLVPALAFGLIAGSARAGTGPAVFVTIHHSDTGCHTWSVNGGPERSSLTVHLRAGGSIEFTNDDVMTHRLVQVAGPHLSMPRAMGVSSFHTPGIPTVRVRFGRPGLYRLRSVDGAQRPGVATSGSDNVLRLTVRVS